MASEVKQKNDITPEFPLEASSEFLDHWVKRMHANDGRMENMESGIWKRKRNRNPNETNKSWRCFDGVTDNNNML